VRLRARWISDAKRRAAGPFALVPLTILSWLYGAITWAHGALYRSGLLRARRIGCRVVSIGSPVAGGSGKTPTAAWVASRLQERGHEVALATRGYGRSGRDPVVVLSDGHRVRSALSEAGDEPALLVGLAPGVPVLVGPDRSVVGLRAISAFGADVLVLDDGMQHHRLARDVEIVTLDGSDGLGSGRVLPRGPLRERLSSLHRADAVIVVDGPLGDRDVARLRRYAPRARCEVARRSARAVRPLAGGRPERPSWLSGREVGLLCAIARPGSLRRTVETLGAKVVAERSFPDHHVYTVPDLTGLASEASCWITTEKDAGKILPGWIEPGVELHVLGISLEMESADDFIDWLDARVR